MTILSADEFPGAEHQPLAYPGVRPGFSYVYYQGKVYEITPRGDTDADLWLDDSTGQITLDDFLKGPRQCYYGPAKSCAGCRF